MTLFDSDQQALNDRFTGQGYAVVPSLGVGSADLDEAAGILDGLFDRFETLPQQFAHDLGGGADRAKPILPEINAVSTLAPALRRTAVFRAAQALAERILGKGAYVIYDHAIYKPSGLAGTTSWHQDSGYDPDATTRLAIWIPFQDTSAVDGAMRYVPRSHLGGALPHLTRSTAEGKTVKYLEVREEDAVDAPCPRGGATMHDLHTIHGAGPNLGEQTRRAWILDFTTGSLAARSIEAAKEKVRVRRFAVT